ncbi:ABC transporter, substrate-binding protein [Fictibacillus macauensis ZFHKF-1]|uniref:ABC transporter, substrate-binding protein n=1 Tax=Fictibacillus macauensis ZFHKF-1 TaxID=1196324 RepID=I8AHA1_9BACL|nr:extracellular solute-binding protein [Fictibacillus macauensis]EIT84814.1 ABC transporter, substrate-binding protein [Fictibacillus macauensis ZFHKF-1]
MKRIFFVLLLFLGGTEDFNVRQLHELLDMEVPNLTNHHVVAYIAAREEVGESLLSSFCKRTGCTYEFVRLPTEELVRKVREERHHPKADIVIGGPLDAHQLLKKEELSMPVMMKDESFTSQTSSSDPDHYWYGYELEQLAIAVNETSWKKAFGNAPLPKTWEDLLDKRLKGKIVLPNPHISGTGVQILQAIAKDMGGKDGVNYLKHFLNNVGYWTANGYSPAEFVASGEYLVGINFLGDQKMLRERQFPMKSNVINKNMYSVNAISKLRDAPHGAVGDLFLAYCLSKPATEILGKVSFGIPVSHRSQQQLLRSIKSGSTQHYKQVLQAYNHYRKP